MSGLEASNFGPDCWRMMDFLKTSQEVKKLAPSVRETREGIDE